MRYMLNIIPYKTLDVISYPYRCPIVRFSFPWWYTPRPHPNVSSLSPFTMKKIMYDKKSRVTNILLALTPGACFLNHGCLTLFLRRKVRNDYCDGFCMRSVTGSTRMWSKPCAQNGKYGVYNRSFLRLIQSAIKSLIFFGVT